jgi:CheY-like chemotaxis protein
VAGVDTGVVAKGQQHPRNRIHQRGVVASRQIRPADGVGKQRVADKQVGHCGSIVGAIDHRETDATRAVPGRVMGANLEVPGDEAIVAGVVMINGRRLLEFEPEHPAHLDGSVVQEGVVPVQADRQAKRALCRPDSRDVIEVRVRQEDVGEGDLLLARITQQAIDLITGIDQHALSGPAARHDEAVLEHRTDRLGLDYDHRVILAIVDDLMFTSKLRNAAKAVDAPITFARSADAALTAMRSSPPSLVIFDLNNPRIDALAIMHAMKQEPLLASVSTVGFSQHTDTVAIAAARSAGVGQVMARGAFFDRLPELLRTALP